ncbi:MAG: biopolymer transporter ExbD [Pseudomonadota bacterium]
MLRARRRARRLSMTSLIDVIFLLLLFFMLSSTFSRFAEVELHSAGTGPAAAPAPETLLFLRLTPGGATLNGQAARPDEIALRVQDPAEATLLISVTEGVTAQALTDVLVAVSRIEGLRFTVLEGA